MDDHSIVDGEARAVEHTLKVVGHLHRVQWGPVGHLHTLIILNRRRAVVHPEWVTDRAYVVIGVVVMVVVVGVWWEHKNIKERQRASHKNRANS